MPTNAKAHGGKPIRRISRGLLRAAHWFPQQSQGEGPGVGGLGMCRPLCQSSASSCDSGPECPCCVTGGVCGALDDGGMHRRAGLLLTVQLLSQQKSVRQPLCTGGELRRADDCVRSGVRMHMCPWYTLAWWDLRGSYVPAPITFEEVEGPCVCP